MKYPRKEAKLCGVKGQQEVQLEREGDLHDGEEDETDGADPEAVIVLHDKRDSAKGQIEDSPSARDKEGALSKR